MNAGKDGSHRARTSRARSRLAAAALVMLAGFGCASRSGTPVGSLRIAFEASSRGGGSLGEVRVSKPGSVEPVFFADHDAAEFIDFHPPHRIVRGDLDAGIEVPDLEPGSWNVIVLPDAAAPAVVREVAVEASRASVVEVARVEGFHVRGTVYRSDATPFPGARVVYRQDGAAREALTDAEGRFALGPFDRGWVDVEVAHRGFRRDGGNLFIEPTNGERVFVLRDLPRLIGRLTVEDTPYSGEVHVTLRALPVSDVALSLTRVTRLECASDGTFDWQGVPMARERAWVLLTTAEPRRCAFVPRADLALDETTDVGTIPLRATREVEVKVVDSLTGAPIERALVSEADSQFWESGAQPADGYVAMVVRRTYRDPALDRTPTTDRAGRVSVRRLFPWDTELVVDADGYRTHEVSLPESHPAGELVTVRLERSPNADSALEIEFDFEFPEARR